MAGVCKAISAVASAVVSTAIAVIAVDWVRTTTTGKQMEESLKKYEENSIDVCLAIISNDNECTKVCSP